MIHPLSLLWPHNRTNQAQVLEDQISVMLEDGNYDHYIFKAHALASSIELGDETYFRTEEIARVKVKDRFGKHIESYRIYRKGGTL